MDKWYNEIKEKTGKDIKLILIGNKIDLAEQKVVNTDEALAKAKTWGIPLMETSAKSAVNVKEAFHDLLKDMYLEMNKNLQNAENKNLENNNGVQLDVNEKKEKNRCC